MKDYFYQKYLTYSYDSRLYLAQTDYKFLKSEIGSSETIQLICIVCGADGGVNDDKYRTMVELTNDKSSKPMFTSLVSSMYTPYMIERVCTRFSKNNETIRAATNILFLFASLKSHLSNEEEKMMDLIFNKK